MPWKPSDAAGKTKKADTTKEKDVWSRVANKNLKKTGNEARAIKIANAVIRKMNRKGD